MIKADIIVSSWMKSTEKMMNCKILLQIVCPKYDFMEHISCIKSLTKTIRNCLDELKKSGFKSIAFPVIGTGMLNYPHDMAAKSIIDTSLDFLRDNKTEEFDIQIIIFDQNVAVYEVNV